MAEMSSSEIEVDIVIDPDNYEDRHIYNSICEYAKVIVRSIADFSTTGLCPKNSKVTLKARTRTREIFPQKVDVEEVTPVNQEQMDVEPPQLTRIDTQIIKQQEERIKKINSRAFSSFLGTSTPLNNIKELNRQIILDLQSSSLKPERIIEIKKIERSQSIDSSNTSLSHDEQGDIRTSTKDQIVINRSVTNVWRNYYYEYPSELIGSSFNKNENVLNYIKYENRDLVVLPILDDSKGAQIIFNSNGKWCPNGGIGPGYLSSKNCPFYMSTGVSNPDAVNFPGMWFPFFRIKTSIPGQDRSISKQERGWIYKAWGLQSVSQLRQRLENTFEILRPTGPETGDFLYCFLEKFSHWWQIQLSLQLPITQEKTLWDTSDILKKFKEIVLKYDYDHFGGDKNCFIPRKTQSINKKYTLDSSPCHTFQKSIIEVSADTIIIDNTPEHINKWLRSGTEYNQHSQYNLCIEDNEDH